MNIAKIFSIGLTSLFLVSQCHATVFIAVPNGSFESTDHADGTGLTYIYPGFYYGWNFTGYENQFGVHDPIDFRFLGTTGNTTPLPSPADGYQYADLGGVAGSVASIENPTPLATIQPFTTYTLGVAAINEYTEIYGSGLGKLGLALLAGVNVVSSSTIDYSTFGLGEMRLLETSFTTGDATDPRVGMGLNVRVSYTADIFYGSNGYFDNVTLSSTPVPEPGSFALLLLAAALMGVRLKAKG